LGRAPRSPEAIDAVVVGLVDRVTRRMRASARAGRTVMLRLRFGDYSRATRSHTLSEATAATLTVLAVARALLVAAMPMIEQRGLTLVGISVGNLERDRGERQLELPLERRSGRAVDAVIDAVRDRFGPAAVTRAVLIGRGERMTAWLLPNDEPVPPAIPPSVPFLGQ
jgi:DNA polymerase-4